SPTTAGCRWNRKIGESHPTGPNFHESQDDPVGWNAGQARATERVNPVAQFCSPTGVCCPLGSGSRKCLVLRHFCYCCSRCPTPPRPKGGVGGQQGNSAHVFSEGGGSGKAGWHHYPAPSPCTTPRPRCPCPVPAARSSASSWS